MRKNYCEETRAILNEFKNVENKLRLLEEESIDGNGGYVEYDKTADASMFDILDVCTQTFQCSFDKNPIVYSTEDNNVIVNGFLPDLNDINFQFRFKDDTGKGCYLYFPKESNDITLLRLNEETVSRLQKIMGVYENWRNDLISRDEDDIKPVKLKQEKL